jgi:riboflavin kinase/FMN adenylyltransferase
MDVVDGVDALTHGVGPVFAVVGVFDGLHLGHLYLLRHLVDVAAVHGARPMVITFDHHPDEILTGKAPPLLLDPKERLTRLAAAGVAVTVVQHFDEALRHTPYDVFIERIRARARLTGFLMTPDAAFGFERQGTPDTLADLGRRDGFDVVVIPPFTLDGRAVRSAEIRTAIAAGDLVEAAALLGRPVTITGLIGTAGDGRTRLEFPIPVALPPDGAYRAQVDGRPVSLGIEGGEAYLAGGPWTGRLTLSLDA